MVKKKVVEKIKDAYKKVEKKIKEPEVQKCDDFSDVGGSKNFITTDASLVEFLQNKFDIKNITVDGDKRTFEFYATEEQVKPYLEGR